MNDFRNLVPVRNKLYQFVYAMLPVDDKLYAIRIRARRCPVNCVYHIKNQNKIACLFSIPINYDVLTAYYSFYKICDYAVFGLC